MNYFPICKINRVGNTDKKDFLFFRLPFLRIFTTSAYSRHVIFSHCLHFRFCLFQVFDDVYTELTMAILQFFQGKPSEEKVYRCMKALVKFCNLSRREVPQLVKMIGPEPSKFSGMSSRVDELIEKVYAHTSKISFQSSFEEDSLL